MFFTHQIWKHPQSLLQSCPCCYSQGICHLQPFYLCHHSLQIQVSEVDQLITNLSMKKIYGSYWQICVFQQGHPRRKGTLSTLPGPDPQEGLLISVAQRVLLQGLNAEQTVIGLQHQVSQSFFHVYVGHSELDVNVRLSKSRDAPLLASLQKSDAQDVFTVLRRNHFLY